MGFGGNYRGPQSPSLSPPSLGVMKPPLLARLGVFLILCNIEKCFPLVDSIMSACLDLEFCPLLGLRGDESAIGEELTSLAVSL